MAISFVNRVSGAAINAGAITLSFSGLGLQTDDLILVMHCDGDTTNNAMPTPTTAGYTDVGSSEQYANGSANDSNSRAWYKYHNGSDVSVQVAGTGGGTNCGTSAAMMAFRGVALSADGGPFSTTPVLTNGTGNANPNNGSIATAAGDAVVIMGACAMAAAGTYTAPTNYTTNAELGTHVTETIEGKAAMAYRLDPGNPEDAAAWAVSGSGAGDAWTAITLALKAAAEAAIVIPHVTMARPLYV